MLKVARQWQSKIPPSGEVVHPSFDPAKDKEGDAFDSYRISPGYKRVRKFVECHRSKKQ